MLNGQETAAFSNINAQRAGEVIPSVEIDRILALRENGLKQYAEGLKMLNSARKLLLAATGGEYLYGFELCVKDAVSWADRPERAENAIKKTVDGKIWNRLMRDTGMFTLMSGKQRDEWDRQINGEDMPEITLDTVLATFNQLHASKGETFEKGIIDVFRSLSWDYKTNCPCKFGAKIIVSRLFNTYSSGYITFSISGRSTLDDLAKVFYLLEERNVPDHRVSDGVKFADHYEREGFSGNVYKGEYFSLRYFKKGTAHITFNRSDLVDRLNDIVARHYPSMLPARV
jgi:hypothetical protein